MPRGIPKSKPAPKVKDPKTVNLKRVVTWTGGSTIEDTCSVFLNKSALFTLDREIKRLKGFEMVSNWTLYDADTNEVLASKYPCLLYTSPSPRDGLLSRMPSSA